MRSLAGFRVTSELGLLVLLAGSAVALAMGVMDVEMAAIASLTAFFVAVLFPVRNTEIFSPLSLLLFSYAIFLLLGALVFEIIRERSYLPQAQLLVFSGFIFLALGLILGNFLFSVRRSNGDYTLYCREQRYIWLLLGVSFVSYLYLLAISGIPLFAENPNHARIQFYSGKGHIAVFVRAAPVLSVALLVDAIIRGSRRRLRRSHIVFVLVIVANALTGARGSTLSIILIYMLVYLSMNGIRVNKLFVFLSAFAALLLLSIVGAQRRFSEISAENMFTELVVILSARPAAVQLVLDRFPQGQEFGLFNYIADLARLIPGVDAGQNVKVRDIIFSNASDMHNLAGINPSLVGEAMMNVGAYGPWLVPLFIGLFASWVYTAVRSGKPSFFKIAAYFTLMAELVIAVSSGLGTRMPGLTISLFWIVVINLLFRRKSVP